MSGEFDECLAIAFLTLLDVKKCNANVITTLAQVLQLVMALVMAVMVMVMVMVLMLLYRFCVIMLWIFPLPLIPHHLCWMWLALVVMGSAHLMCRPWPPSFLLLVESRSSNRYCISITITITISIFISLTIFDSINHIS